MTAPILLAVMGPTASGKTGLAETIADRLDAQLINADAFQVYRGMDIGTAKPQRRADYRLLDLKDPREGFGVGEFVGLALHELVSLFSQGRSAVVVGGTGLYIRALMERYQDLRPAPDPEVRAELTRRLAEEGLPSLVAELERVAPDVAERIDRSNPARVVRALERSQGSDKPLEVELPPFRRMKVVLDPPAEVLHARIEQRADEMVQNGWVDEVASLRRSGVVPGDPGMRAIGYRPIFGYLVGDCTLEDARQRAITETKQYAKRQRTWLRSEPNVTAATASVDLQEVVKVVFSAIDGMRGY